MPELSGLNSGGLLVYEHDANVRCPSSMNQCLVLLLGAQIGYIAATPCQKSILE